MHRHATYSYSQPATTHRYSSTSSAFSASANPNEDWTKISDLAERRRIQNRIAQRNYRKKLKKRLEDLERRAASNSASPEQRPAELDRSATQAREEQQPQQQQQQRQEAAVIEPVEQQDHRRSAESYSYPYPSHPEDRGLFSHQYTRQLSTSPPPFSYSNYPTPESTTYAPYAPHTSYYSLPTTTTPELPVFSPYLPPLSSAYSNTLPSMVHPVKQEYYEEEISPFSMSYASMAGIDIPAPHSYQESNPQTPPLSDSFDASAAGSPPESTVYPTTPASMPGTPPLHLLH